MADQGMNEAFAMSYRFQADELRRALEEFTEEQLREHCAEKARRFTDAMFRLGAVGGEGAETGDMPNFRPGPHVIPDVLVGTMTSEHVGKITAFYHRAHQGDVRQLLGDLSNWNAGVADALLSGETLPPCVYCGGDHSPRV